MKDSHQILGIKLDNLSRHQAMDRIKEFFNRKSTSLICTVNSEFIMMGQHNEQFHRALTQKSSLNLIDGSGVVWAIVFCNIRAPKSRFVRTVYLSLIWLLALIFYPIVVYFARRHIHKISGADFVWDICKWASDNGKSVFMLGNKYGLDPNAAQKASLELQTNIYNLKIAGTFSSTPDGDDEKTNIEMIKRSGADIVLCAFGSPSQEIWLAKNLGRTGAKIGIGLGGTFDFVAGVQKRAPRFISAIGFEWLWRLAHQPRRIKRQSALPRFAIAVLRQRLRG